MYGLFLLIVSLYAWVPAQLPSVDLDSIYSIYFAMAIFVVVVTVITQVFKVRAEKKYYAQAVNELNAVWQK